MCVVGQSSAQKQVQHNSNQSGGSSPEYSRILAVVSRCLASAPAPARSPKGRIEIEMAKIPYVSAGSMSTFRQLFDMPARHAPLAELYDDPAANDLDVWGCTDHAAHLGTRTPDDSGTTRRWVDDCGS